MSVCCSASSLRADRRDKLLKRLDTRGSKLHAEQQAEAVYEDAMQAGRMHGYGSYTLPDGNPATGGMAGRRPQWTRDLDSG